MHRNTSVYLNVSKLFTILINRCPSEWRKNNIGKYYNKDISVSVKGKGLSKKNSIKCTSYIMQTLLSVVIADCSRFSTFFCVDQKIEWLMVISMRLKNAFSIFYKKIITFLTSLLGINQKSIK